MVNTNDFPLTVHSGNYGAFLGDNMLATLSQPLATVWGEYYLLSLWLDNPSPALGQEFLVNWNTNGATANAIYSISNPAVFASTTCNSSFPPPAPARSWSLRPRTRLILSGWMMFR